MPSSRCSETGKGLWCVIPALNAAETIASVVLGLRRSVPEAGIIVVDDGSSDGTGGMASSAGATVLRHDRNRGKGAALRTGLAHALQDPDMAAVVTLDADEQHRPEDIPRLIHRLNVSDADLVVGSRRRFGAGMPLHRILSNTITTFLVSARIGQPVADSQSGFRMMRRAVLEQVVIHRDGFEAETEFLLVAARAGFRIDHEPIQTVYAGERSHMTGWRTTVNFIRVLFQAP